MTYEDKQKSIREKILKDIEIKEQQKKQKAKERYREKKRKELYEKKATSLYGELDI